MERRPPRQARCRRPPESAGVADTITESLTPYQQATSVGGYLAVSAVVDELQIYDHVPPGSTLKLTFPRTGTNQVTSTFLAIGKTTDPKGYTRYQIRLPARPNGSTGWVRVNDMVPTPLTHAIGVDPSDHRIDLYELGTKVRSYPLGVGRNEDSDGPRRILRHSQGPSGQSGRYMAIS